MAKNKKNLVKSTIDDLGALHAAELGEEEQATWLARIQELAETFLDFALKLAGKVPFVPDAVAMYYVMIDAKTPLKPRVLAAAALAYFVSPIDAIPDAIPVIGYLDDAAVVFYAMHLIHEHITEEHVAAAQKLLRQKTA